MDVKHRLTEILDMNCGYTEEMKAEDMADYLIENGVTVRKKGKWKLYVSEWHEGFHEYYDCPFCGERFIAGELNFCPNCGADMRGDSE